MSDSSMTYGAAIRWAIGEAIRPLDGKGPTTISAENAGDWADEIVLALQELGLGFDIVPTHLMDGIRGLLVCLMGTPHQAAVMAALEELDAP